MSTRLADPMPGCPENPGCEFTVQNRGAQKISEVGIYSQYLSEPDLSIVLGLRVG
ncbi:hypothetical protein [Actinomadura coerulea]|uniref:hypothetical protein n=1 Tax=Actinomadura coerulea TaxID=46159 RepID=UPI00343E378A